LKLKCDEPLSNFAFNFNLRRFAEAEAAYRHYLARVNHLTRTPGSALEGAELIALDERHGRAVQVDSIKIRLESAPGFSA
jgi:hypothetical protein